MSISCSHVFKAHKLFADFRGFCTNSPSDENAQPTSQPSVIVDRLEVSQDSKCMSQGLLLVSYIIVSGHAYSDNWDKQAGKEEFS